MTECFPDWTATGLRFKFFTPEFFTNRPGVANVFRASRNREWTPIHANWKGDSDLNFENWRLFAVICVSSVSICSQKFHHLPCAIFVYFAVESHYNDGMAQNGDSKSSGSILSSQSLPLTSRRRRGKIKEDSYA
jgi:hypothetical protein